MRVYVVSMSKIQCCTVTQGKLAYYVTKTKAVFLYEE